MKVEQFFLRYANQPLAERLLILDYFKHGETTLQSIYTRVHQLEDEMRPKRIEQDELIRIAENYWIKKRKESNENVCPDDYNHPNLPTK